MTASVTVGKTPEAQLPLATWLAALAVGALALTALGFGFYRDFEVRTRREAFRNLSIVGQLKAAQIQHWRRERLADIRRVVASPLMQKAVADWLRDPGRARVRLDLLARLKLETASGEYQEALLLDPTGRPLLTTSAPSRPLGATAKHAVQAACFRCQEALSDFFQAPGGIYVDAMAPILDSTGRPLAVAILRSRAGDFLYPLIQSWPTSSPSGESLLVRRDGGDVLFLNQLRHRGGAALSLRIPLARRDNPAAQAVLGRRGAFPGRDHRGEKVLADLRPVPGSPWHFVSKVDESEALAEARGRAAAIALFVSLFVLLGAAATAYYYQRRQSRLYRDLYQAERSEREAREEFRATLYSIGDALIVASREGLVKQMNPVAERLTGWAEAEARCKPLDQVFRIVNEESRAPVESPVTRVLAEGRVVGLANHTLLVSRDGQERPIADSGAPVRDAAGALSGVVLVFRDQTEVRRAEKEILRLNRLYRAWSQVNQFIARIRSQEDLLTGVCRNLVDHGGLSLAWIGWLDPVAGALTPIARHGLDQAPPVLLLPNSPDHPDGPTSRALIERRALVSNDIAACPDSADWLPLAPGRHSGSHGVFPIQGDNGLYGVLQVHADETGFFRDEEVTLFQEVAADLACALDRFAAEAARRQAESRLHQAQKMELVGQLAGGIAHDFNNLLTVINGYAQMTLARLHQDDPIRPSLAQIYRAGDRAASLVRQLLAFSRKQVMQRRLLDLNQVAAELEPMLVRLLGDEVDLSLQLDARSPEVLADPHQLEQVIVNLAVNARDAMPLGGRLSIETSDVQLDRPPGPHVLLTVRDNGTGMDESTRCRIFEPFFTTKGVGKGTGLGLSVVQGIIEQTGGFIEVDSEPGRGSTFRIYLPAASLTPGPEYPETVPRP